MNIIKKIKFKLQSAFLKKKLKKSGRFMICNPLRIEGACNIEIGNYVFIQEQAWLAAPSIISDDVSLKIFNNVYIGDYAHIYATNQIVIEADVMIANNVYISDNTHEFEDVNVAIKNQAIKNIRKVIIGEGSWIGEKVSILGASVGKHSIIGANSVVTKNIPDYSVAVGSPAKVIKKYNFETKEWDKV